MNRKGITIAYEDKLVTHWRDVDGKWHQKTKRGKVDLRYRTILDEQESKEKPQEKSE